MKKIFSIMMSCIMLACGLTSVTHASGDNITVTINGSNIYFDQPPIIQNERTLVPMRAIFEAMGCEVVWDGFAQSVDVYKDDQNIMTLWVGDYDMWTPDGYIELDGPPQIVNERTLVPVRAISETIGADVNWSSSSKTVYITYNDKRRSNTAFDTTETYAKNTSSVYTKSLKASEFDVDYKIKMTVGEHQTVTWNSDIDVDVSEIVFYSDDESIATIDDRGRIIAVSAGKTMLHADFGRFSCGFDMLVEDEIKYKQEEQKQNIVEKINSGNLEIYDDGNFKTVTIASGESFMAKNTTSSSFRVNVQGSEYAKRVDYVIYKDDGNVLKTEYNRAINLYGNIEIKTGYSIGIYNPNDYEITVKGPSDAFYPEDRDAFDIINISTKQGAEVFNDTQTSYDILVVGNQYDAKRLDYIVYKDDGNVLTSEYDRAINLYGKIEIKAGYSVGIYNSNKDAITVLVPSDVVSYSYSDVFDIRKLNPGQSCSVSNNTKTKFEICVRSATNAKKFDYVTYNDNGETVATEYGRTINLYGQRELKPGYSISISNSSDDEIMVYIPENVN